MVKVRRLKESGSCVLVLQVYPLLLIGSSNQNTLQSEGFEDEASLEETIKKLEGDLKKARKKDEDLPDDPVVCPTLSLPRRLLMRFTGRAVFPIGGCT